MPQRTIILANNEIYHVFNRSIAGTEIFSGLINMRKIFEIIDYYRFRQKLRLSKFKSLSTAATEVYLNTLKTTTPLVDIYAFAFMPNHFHFLVKQVQNDGISRFVANLQNSFAKVFNLKNERHGSVFQSQFKAKRIETDYQFIHVSRYIHLNPVTSYLIEFNKLQTDTRTSFPAYATGKEIRSIKKDFLLSMFSSSEDYVRFVSDQADYQKELAFIKNLILE